MNYLISQFIDRRHCRGREYRLQINNYKNKIRYIALNQIVFIIDCSDAGASGSPGIYSNIVRGCSASHDSHTLGKDTIDGGQICLAESINGWDLDRILFYCDSWAKGFCIYKRTGKFPNTPKSVFNTN